VADCVWTPGQGDQPIPPQNVEVVNPFVIGVLDIRWDDPSILARNAVYNVVGVNLYRSDVSDRGPFFRVNEFPIGGTFYRDRTDNIQVRETVNWDRDWVFKGNAPNDRRWVFRTKHPISKKHDSAPFQKQTMADTPDDVTVIIDGVVVTVEDVFGMSGEVTLINQPTFNVTTEKSEPPVLPTATSIVEVIYYANRNHIRTGLDANIWYRLTTVVLDATTPSGYAETSLDWCKPQSLMEVERLDYIWREAIRRNQWILQQGGERVKIFIKKQAGVPCTCKMDPRTREYNKQPSNRCLTCFGTGYVGGYEGPYDVIVAPDDAERRISQSPQGRRKEHTYEVFMGPSPVVTQRDFIVKQTNERYSIGPSRRPSNRGNLLQQHFNIAYFDEGDIRYQVPIDGTTQLAWPQTRYGFRHAPDMPVDGELALPPSTMPDKPAYPTGPWTGPGTYGQLPMQTEKAETPDDKEQRGRTPVWENTSY